MYNIYLGLVFGLSISSYYLIKNYNYKVDTKYIEMCMVRYE